MLSPGSHAVLTAVVCSKRQLQSRSVAAVVPCLGFVKEFSNGRLGASHKCSDGVMFGLVYSIRLSKYS